LKGLSEEKCFE